MLAKKFILNTVSALVNQFTMIGCAFILPRLILQNFGSEVNGLVSSIQQFLTIITFMELGVGAVVQASLYKPLAKNDSNSISKIIKSANSFFIKLAIIMFFYVVSLLFLYPIIVKTSFDNFYVDTLILSMSISYFAQYFFGLKNQLLVIADQKGYIHYGLNTLVLVLNNIIGVFMILNGTSIQIIKLSTSLILLLRPLLLEIYVRKNYNLNRKIKYVGEPIRQKWNGVAQHVATVVLNSTDSIVLSIFSTLSSVSIYNIYYLVINGLNNLVVSLTSGFQSYIGNLLANEKYEQLNDSFDIYETIFHIIVTFIFSTVCVLIVPFVLVYTDGVYDIDYNVPVFAILLSIANMIYCIRLPYNTLIKTAGHFKQTQNSAWLEVIINIIVSILMVYKFGLLGVAIGTLVAMTYRTIYLVYYLAKNIIYRKAIFFWKHILTDGICLIFVVLVGKIFNIHCTSYLEWMWIALKVAFINMVICMSINIVLFYNQMKCSVIYFFIKKNKANSM
ncbi:polysaccharide biosynthesis C-terminal domain-containing protein [[Clostridium] spiroforme]|nr:polysaccharide biosynthesis C-terminal domain-containing protein [Thomasclavelia spiroformis]